MRQQKCECYEIQTTEGLVREEDWMDLLFGWESIAYNFKVTRPKRDCIHLGDVTFNMKYQQQYYKGSSGKFGVYDRWVHMEVSLSFQVHGPSSVTSHTQWELHQR